MGGNFRKYLEDRYLTCILMIKILFFLHYSALFNRNRLNKLGDRLSRESFGQVLK